MFLIYSEGNDTVLDDSAVVLEYSVVYTLSLVYSTTK